MVQKGSKNGEFSVPSFFLLWCSCPYPVSLIWISSTPSKICFFTWLACRGRIPTINLLMARSLVSPYRCIMCCSEAESVDHLLIHFKVASFLWTSMLRCFGVSWVFSASAKEVWVSWQLKGAVLGAPRGNLIWSATSFAICWSIWLEGNRRILFDSTTELHRILDNM